MIIKGEEKDLKMGGGMMASDVKKTGVSEELELSGSGRLEWMTPNSWERRQKRRKRLLLLNTVFYHFYMKNQTI